MAKRSKRLRFSNVREINSLRVSFDGNRVLTIKTVPEYFGNNSNNVLIRFCTPELRSSHGVSAIFAGNYSIPDLVWTSHRDCDVLSLIQRPRFTMVYLRNVLRMSLSKRER
jgi:hypothetical protein